MVGIWLWGSIIVVWTIFSTSVIYIGIKQTFSRIINDLSKLNYDEDEWFEEHDLSNSIDEYDDILYSDNTIDKTPSQRYFEGKAERIIEYYT